MKALRTVSPTLLRRMAIARQRLSGPAAGPDRERLLDIVRDLGCLQLDPIRAVERSHLLVLWSRVGRFDPAELDALLWEERRLFEYWAHRASIVLTEDYPIHHLLMRRYPSERYAYSRRVKTWLRENQALRRHVLDRIRKAGPLRLRDFEDRARTGWTSSGWTTGRNVERMLDCLWTQGRIVVAGRNGIEKVWDLADRWFPHWTPRETLTERQVVRRASQRSLRALGVARPRDIDRHFTIGRYPGLLSTLRSMERSGAIERVRVMDEGSEWPGPWFIHAQDVPLLEEITAGEWSPRTTLLSPFDNLIIDRDRTESLFGFRFRM
ncbi:MAG TPA: crosslink repair DNA glycosylase YcaQ family protein, partial [Actinomycetota bacterium]|nr:crosslink repair DNA glycosylase YcaQ family protein [Actinomycetota bacterium]